MKARILTPFIWLTVLILIVGLACSFSVGTTPTPQPSPPTQAELPTKAPLPTEKPAATTAPATAPAQASGAVSDLTDVKNATIQIESQGTFIDPQVGLVVNGAGRGSGFIIDPSGIAVTNNHVVTGAALLKVWVGGDPNPHNAKVLGVSECSDLAVIDIDGDGYPYLKWYNGPINVGMDMYVAGYPLGEPEYSLTKGIISKEKANGETSWASVESVIEYDATTNPGNSGGPVINPDGQVIGIHYAGNSSTRQAFGISRDVAEGVISQLEQGKNVDTIGVNGQAVSNQDGSLTGVWVSSVQSGSPADKAGVQPGDIITMMENLVLATDGTMSQYCDILRSHNPTDTLNITVLRYASGEILDGQLNGRQLAVTGTFGSGGSSGGSTQESSTATAQGDPNATGSGSYFFSTEFDNSDNWYTFAVPKTDNYQASVDNSTLYLEADDKNSTVYALYDLDLQPSDVRLDAAVETVAGPNRNNISLVCRATDAGWYEFSMNSGGYWYIYKYDNNDYTLLNSGASTAINLQKAKNELTATCIGSKLTFYVNQVRMGSATDNRFKGGGQAGVSVSDFDISGAGVEFDWFAATVP
jgi:S1-C subfamily serine protease